MIWFLHLLQVCFAEQVNFQRTRGSKETTYHYEWYDHDKNTFQAEFSLPKESIRLDNTYKVVQTKHNLHSIKMENEDYEVIEQHIRVNYIKLALQYAPSVEPIARALFNNGDTVETHIATMLHFTQSIPYERRARDTFRRPLSLIEHNKGDCDSKALLLMSLIHSVYPDVPIAIVFIPHHAFVAIHPQLLTNQASHRIDGRPWKLLEPVGPAMFPLGMVSNSSADRILDGNYQIISYHPIEDKKRSYNRIPIAPKQQMRDKG